MKIMDRIVGIWMIIAGGALFVFAHMILPEVETFSGVTYFAVGIPAAILLAVPTGTLLAYGTAQTTGKITIRIEGGN